MLPIEPHSRLAQPSIPQPMPRRKSYLWKFTFWLTVTVLLAQAAWLGTVPFFRERLRTERAMPRVEWLTWPSEIDSLQTSNLETSFNLANGPHLKSLKIVSQSAGGRLGAIKLRGKICWEKLPRIVEPWNIRLEMAVIAITDERFLSTTRGNIHPEFSSKRPNWSADNACEQVSISSDFILPRDGKFYGYIIRVFYKEGMSDIISQPENLVYYFPLPKPKFEK